MCETCGCEAAGHSHGRRARTILLGERILAKNDRLAEENRRQLAARRVRMVNVMSSPGSGKTTLLERAVRELGPELPLAVIEGDQATALDAERIRAVGGRAVQINTGAGCHLDAAMLASALDRLAPPPGGLVLVENVGNLVCPALFDLGQRATMVLASVTEGADKPLKYPTMFRAADLVVLNKADLLPHVEFRVEEFFDNVRAVRPEAGLMLVSAATGEGVEAWFGWLRALRVAPAEPAPGPASSAAPAARVSDSPV